MADRENITLVIPTSVKTLPHFSPEYELLNITTPDSLTDRALLAQCLRRAADFIYVEG